MCTFYIIGCLLPQPWPQRQRNIQQMQDWATSYLQDWVSTSSIGTIYFALVQYSAENLSFVYKCLSLWNWGILTAMWVWLKRIPSQNHPCFDMRKTTDSKHLCLMTQKHPCRPRVVAWGDQIGADLPWYGSLMREGPHGLLSWRVRSFSAERGGLKTKMIDQWPGKVYYLWIISYTSAVYLFLNVVVVCRSGSIEVNLSRPLVGLATGNGWWRGVTQRPRAIGHWAYWGKEGIL